MKKKQLLTRNELRSPLEAVQKKYIREHSYVKFNAFFDVATKAKKLHALNLQRNRDLQMLHATATTSATTKPTAAQEEKELCRVIRQQSQRKCTYSPPTYRPPAKRETWTMSNEQKERRIKSRERIRPSTAPPSRHRSNLNPISPAFQLGPFGTGFDQKWALKMKAVADSQHLFGNNSTKKDMKNKQFRGVRFRPSSARRRVQMRNGYSKVLDCDGLSCVLPGDCKQDVLQYSFLSRAKDVERKLRQDILFQPRVVNNKR